ncbi:MAG TPA: D-alanine--D-alanine ligase [Candidatus Hypogeohydataceae bacterium YC41]
MARVRDKGMVTSKSPPKSPFNKGGLRGIKVAVLMGGVSTEREVSLRSGQAVSKGLQDSGYSVIPIVVEDTKVEKLDHHEVDLAFIALHGYFGEDGEIQALLETKGVPYTGSGARASKLAINKAESKKVFRAGGLPTPDFLVLKRHEFLRNRGCIAGQLGKLSLPLVVKPACNGSSLGVTIVKAIEGVVPALEVAFNYDDIVLLEAYVMGQELTVGVLGEEALPLIEIKPSREFYDFEAKYKDNNTCYILHPKLPDGVYQEAQDTALKAHRALGCSDFSRVDMICDELGNLHILEVNTIPGFTERSLLPKAAQATGMSFSQLCSKIVELALSRNKVHQGESHTEQTCGQAVLDRVHPLTSGVGMADMVPSKEI